jgi:hypothetical protein
VKIYPFNVTNPYEYVTGSTAKINELGLYAIDVQQYRKNVDLSKSEGTISFDLWNEVEFNTKKSCPTCASSDLINVPHIGFLSLLSQVQNEAALMLQATCSSTQIGLITNPQTFPYCTPAQMGGTDICVCCAPTPTVNATTCNALTNTTTKTGGLLSYLAKYDNGVQLDDVPSTTFLLSTGTYTPLIRQLTVLELAFGSISAYVGMFKTAKAVRTNDRETIYEIGNTTIDLRDACVLNCPSVASVVAKFPTEFLAAFQNVECEGYVPSADVLVSQGNLTQERADQLRYLEGVSCRSFGVNIATSAVIQATSPTATNVCSDGSSTLPCCLLSSTSPLVTATGIGCQFFVAGLVQSRRVFSEEEALNDLIAKTGTKVLSPCPLPLLLPWLSTVPHLFCLVLSFSSTAVVVLVVRNSNKSCGKVKIIMTNGSLPRHTPILTCLGLTQPSCAKAKTALSQAL